MRSIRCRFRALLPALATAALVSVAVNLSTPALESSSGSPLQPTPSTAGSEPFAEAPQAEPLPPESELHPVEYTDGSTSSNDRCPIRKRKLNTKIEPVWVNQHPIGFC